MAKQTRSGAKVDSRGLEADAEKQVTVTTTKNKNGGQNATVQVKGFKSSGESTLSPNQ